MAQKKDSFTAELGQADQKLGGTIETKHHKKLPPLELVQERFEVSANSPSGLIWKIKRKSKNPGDVAGTKRPSGHWQVKINNEHYGVHRIIFLLQHGYDPGEYVVDHIKGIENPLELRIATRKQNRYNSKSSKTKNRTSKYKGVYWHKADQKWGVSIKAGDIRIYKTYLESEKEAALKYNELALKYHGEFAVLNVIEDDEN